MKARAAGIVLAAGEGSRIGLPKAILRIDGEPLAARASASLADAGISPIRIVIGCRHEEVLEALPIEKDVVVNKGWHAGQFSSLRAGLETLDADSWVVVLPVDTIGVLSETVTLLIEAADDRFDAVVPTYDGRRGHPVLLSPPLCRHILALDAAASRLDRILGEAKTLALPVDDRAILTNINTPEDFDRIPKSPKPPHP